jgi:pSer/pThr/pTyr-binding forkhead associated (FHA) protein
MARLVVMYGDKHEQTIGLDVPSLLIGRGDDAGLQVRNQTVSRHHCRVELDGNKHVVVDLKSTSGTFLNGTRVDRTLTLQHGDRIELGKHTLIYERDAVETGAPLLSPLAGEAPTDNSGAGFWRDGLKESGFKEGADPGTSSDDGAPWEAGETKSASELATETRQSLADNYAGTMLASADEMKRIRETLRKQQKPHLSVVVKGKRQLVAMEGDTLTVGYFEGADFRLEGSRFFGRRQFLIFESGSAWMVKPTSIFARIRVKGKRIKSAEILTGGEVIRSGGLKFKFSKGD